MIEIVGVRSGKQRSRKEIEVRSKVRIRSHVPQTRKFDFSQLIRILGELTIDLLRKSDIDRSEANSHHSN